MALGERFERGRERFRDSRLVLQHGDLWPTNCFVEEDTGRFTGLIDFGDAAIGPATAPIRHR